MSGDVIDPAELKPYAAIGPTLSDQSAARRKIKAARTLLRRGRQPSFRCSWSDFACSLRRAFPTLPVLLRRACRSVMPSRLARSFYHSSRMESSQACSSTCGPGSSCRVLRPWLSRDKSLLTLKFRLFASILDSSTICFERFRAYGLG